MTLDALIAAWEEEALRPLPNTPQALAIGLRAVATLVEVAGEQFSQIDNTSVVASEQQRARAFAVLTSLSNAQTESDLAVAYKVVAVLAAVALLRLLQSVGLFEGI